MKDNELERVQARFEEHMRVNKDAEKLLNH
jgi:hypothetical protein